MSKEALQKYSQILDELECEGRLRILQRKDKNVIFDLTSNDYMGLAHQENEFIKEFNALNIDTSYTSSASRLLISRPSTYSLLEDYLEALYNKPALIFNSGYHANIGIIQALTIPGTLWIVDKLIHASAIDGLKLAAADYKRFPHNDLAKLRTILTQHCESYQRVIILVEGIYSMDGDKSPLREIVELKRKYPNVLIYIDEAHSFGVLGKRGLGLAESLGLIEDVDILIGTLGKAAASSGAFLITSPLLRNYIINKARSLIYSTAIPPISVAWSKLMIEKLTEMESERAHLKLISDKFRKGLETITGIPNPSDSGIVPLIIGDANRTVRISRLLEAQGILALPIRRPTVPPGGERIRFSIHSLLSEYDIDEILKKIKRAYES